MIKRSERDRKPYRHYIEFNLGMFNGQSVCIEHILMRNPPDDCEMGVYGPVRGRIVLYQGRGEKERVASCYREREPGTVP